MHPVRRFPIRLLSSLSILVALAAGSAVAVPNFDIALEGNNLMSGIPFEAGVGVSPQFGGELSRAVPLGPIGINGPALAEGYASDSGTFWGLARTGFTPYYAHTHVAWSETYVKQSATDTIEAEITGGEIKITDFGGDPSINFLGEVHFVAAVIHPNVSTIEFEHTAEVTGFFDNWTLVQNSGDLAIHTDFTTRTDVGLSGHETAVWSLENVTIFFDLQDVPIGDSFDVVYVVDLYAQGRGGETSAGAYFRDPISPTGGITVTPLGPIPVPEPALGGLVVLAPLLLERLGARRRTRRRGTC